MIKTLSDALSERGYDTLTPVQEAVTDPALERRDLLVSAQTGSGKTVGFGLAIGPTLLGEETTFGPAAAPLALVVAPTRELAFQVTRELGWLYAGADARIVPCVGGMDMRDERRALERGAHVVVGTPGRLRDHIQRGSLDMGSLRAVVLDEADEMLDLGFREDLEFMLGAAPAERRTLMFSATVPPMIATLARNYQTDAARVETTSGRDQHADIAYQAVRVAAADAENAIVNLLRFHEAQNAIVFANTRATVNRLTARFANRGFAVVCLSGELSQSERSHALQAMRDGRARVCVATDVAARGIDLPNLELVIHAELPSNVEGLLHRSGRTGRAGRKGISALIVPPRATGRAEGLLKRARVTADWIAAPGADEILRRDEDRLMEGAIWTDEVTETEAAFVERLVAAKDPRDVAAACLRLYRAQHSAPEELGAPEARPAPKERAPFGEGAWVSLSVGRDARAEPRWLLPLLCRAGGLDRDAIGAIRVQASETLVEISAPRLPAFLAGLGPDGALEKGVTARPVESPDVPAPEKRPSKAEARPAPHPERDTPARPLPSEKPSAPVAPAPGAKVPKPAAKGTGTKMPAPARAKGKAAAPGTAPKGKGPKAPRPAGGPAHKGAASKAGGKPAKAPRASASDTSKRFTPPGRSAPVRSSARPGQGGTRPPKRRTP